VSPVVTVNQDYTAVMCNADDPVFEELTLTLTRLPKWIFPEGMGGVRTCTV